MIRIKKNYWTNWNRDYIRLSTIIIRDRNIEFENTAFDILDMFGNHMCFNRSFSSLPKITKKKLFDTFLVLVGFWAYVIWASFIVFFFCTNVSRIRLFFSFWKFCLQCTKRNNVHNTTISIEYSMKAALGPYSNLVNFY